MKLNYVRATVVFYPPSRGGRPTVPVGDGYAPYLRPRGATFYGLAVRLYGMPDHGGQYDVPYSVEIEMTYHPRRDYSSLTPGATFIIVEGPQAVGEGEVMSRRYER
jgi:hypothetical protein